jgi:quercetin dioxygenase-like cupin family protein
MPYEDPRCLASLPFVQIAEVKARHEGEPRWREPLSGSGAGRMMLTCLPAGFVGSPHFHKYSEEWFIPLEGAAEFSVGEGEWTRAEPGAIVFGPRHVPHALRVVGAEPFLMLCIVAPNVPDDETSR